MNLQFTYPPVLVLMGVSGSGKTTVGAVLAGRLGWDLAEGDDMHPPANVAKMAAGQALTDEDRWPWLERIRGWIDEHLELGQPGIVTCSALKRSYRDVLRGEHVVFVFLNGPRDQLAGRLAVRQGHFMPASLLDTQLADLEEPDDDEQALRIDAGPSPAVLAAMIVDKLALD